MKKRKLTVTIGIPAYNEAANIVHLVEDILSQEAEGFNLNEVIIISDGSKDRTVANVKKIKSKKVKVIKGTKRLGKIIRFNQLLKLCKGDIFVQFDSDVLPKNRYTLKNLVRPFLKDKELVIVHGNVSVASPTLYAEKLAQFGFDIWQEAKRILGSKANRYRSIGTIRAFSREFVDEFTFPKGSEHCEDLYTYYFAYQMGWKMKFISNAVVYFRLSSTFKDYIKQMVRYIKAPDEINKFFKEDVIREHETITTWVKLRALINVSFKRPNHIVMLYILLQLVTYLAIPFYKQNYLWSVSKSTKRVIKNVDFRKWKLAKSTKHLLSYFLT